MEIKFNSIEIEKILKDLIKDKYPKSQIDDKHTHWSEYMGQDFIVVLK